VNIDPRVVFIAVVVIPLAVLWVVALFHILARRPDLSVEWKAIWSAAVILVPFVGLLLYAVLRPPRTPKRSGGEDPSAVSRAVQRIRELSAAHEEGEVDDESFAAQKAIIFGLTDSTV
jgi:hypothetical protein